MERTGIVRKLDELGRVVLPIELRRSLDWKVHDRVEIYTQAGGVVLRKYEPNCCLCGEGKNLTEFMGKRLCDACIAKIKQL